jgi:hypothetical protein
VLARFEPALCLERQNESSERALCERKKSTQHNASARRAHAHPAIFPGSAFFYVLWQNFKHVHYTVVSATGKAYSKDYIFS